MKVYLINTMLMDKNDDIDFKNITDAEFINLSSDYGMLYSIRGFENACNQDDFDHMNTYIRFIE